MTVAVADAFLSVSPADTDAGIRQTLVKAMQHFGRKYRDIGYGAKFLNWLLCDDPQPYGSWGNGSAMRVSSAGWLFNDLETVRRMARLSALVSHDHPQAIDGAEAVASAIFLARTGKSKEEIKHYTQTNFPYDLSRSCDEIRPGYRHDVRCLGTVPEAITAFLEGRSFEDVIRTAVSLGGDCDTLTCIAGAMAEAYYGVPESLKDKVQEYLPTDLADVLLRFSQRISI